MSRHARDAALLAIAVLTLSGCGGSGAAEPGTAPPIGTLPAGRVVQVGEQAEGVVADPLSHLVAVGVRNPARLVLVDGRTGVITARVPLPGHLRHLHLAAPGGPVLVPGEATGTLITVGLPSGAVTSRVPIGRYAHDATVTASGIIAVADELGKALVLVRDGQVVHRFTDVTQPGGLTAVGDLIALVDVEQHTLSSYDTTRPARRARVPAGDGPTHLVADRRGRLLVADTHGNRLLTFTTTPTLRRVASTRLPGTPYGLAYDPTRDRLWVTLTARNQVVGLDLTDPRPREITRLPTVRQPNTVAVHPDTGRIFVASRTDGTVQLIDPPA
jgi:DNA-binding beta-propeller fold protein YncE